MFGFNMPPYHDAHENDKYHHRRCRGNFGQKQKASRIKVKKTRVKKKQIKQQKKRMR